MSVGGLIAAGLAGAVGGVAGAVVGRLAGRKRAMPVQARLQQLFGFLGIVIGAVLGQALFSQALADRIDVMIGAKSRAEIIMLRAMDPISQSPKFQAALRGKNASEAGAYGASLAARGIPLLDAASLDTWASTRFKLAQSSPALCALMWKGGAAPQAIATALDTLNDEELERWAALTARGVQLALDGRPPPAVPPDTGEAALRAIGAALPEGERAAFDSDVTRTDLSDARACAIHQAVMRNALKLEPPLRTNFYRLLASQM